MTDSGPGTIYLLHFDGGLPRNGHGDAQHYLGWTNEELGSGDRALDRVNEHLAGRGNPLVAAAVRRGSHVECVRVWAGDRTLESKLKKRKNNRKLCPLCQEDIRRRQRQWQRDKRERDRRRNATSGPADHQGA